MVGTASAVALILLIAACGQVNLSGESNGSITIRQLHALQTEVAEQRQVQEAQATTIAEQASQATRLSEFVSYLATVVPRVNPTLVAPSLTPFVPVSGAVILEAGRCCVGGIVGQPLTLHAELLAHSQAGEVIEMRTYLGPATATIRDLANQPWEPFRPQVTFEIVPGINWVGTYVSAQFRDSQGAVSEITWDDISVEGMPPPPTSPP
jgi:hypothetical protein